MAMTYENIIKIDEIESLLENNKIRDPKKLDEILHKAKELKGLELDEIAYILNTTNENDLSLLSQAAIYVKQKIYGPRLVLFAPLYTTNYCSNDCLYCGFRSSNISTKGRKRLSYEEIKQETEAIIMMGHKRVLMVAGEDTLLSPKDLAKQVETIYSVKLPKGNIRRVNVNAAPMETSGFRELKSVGIGTYQCFQETYHPQRYQELHIRGPKKDYDYRINVFDRCITAGIDDFGMGVLFGLYDYKFEILALMQHIKYLESKFGIGPHTISIPRLEPAIGTDIYKTSPWLVSDDELLKITAILRLSVPYTGIILSTREPPALRHKLLEVGVSQMSAGSITNPGGYYQKIINSTQNLHLTNKIFSNQTNFNNQNIDSNYDTIIDHNHNTNQFESPETSKILNNEQHSSVSQFHIQDNRSLDEVIKEVCRENYIPSFCTGCYRKGRTGEIFQEMAKHQYIDAFCSLNAVATLQEYAEDFASEETKLVIENCLDNFIASQTDTKLKNKMIEWRKRIKNGERDIPY